MSRHVFPNAQVAHVWAAQSQSDGRSNNGNLYFRGKTIFSYRDSWPLATFTGLFHGGSEVVIVNDQSYSISTSGHLRKVRGALGGLRVYQVPTDCDCLIRYLAAPTREGAKLRIVANAITALKTAAAEYAKPRKQAYLGCQPDTCSNRCAAVSDGEIVETAAALGVPLPHPALPSYDLKVMRNAILEAFTAFYAPSTVAKREKAAIKRNANCASLFAIVHGFSSGRQLSWQEQKRLPDLLKQGLTHEVSRAKALEAFRTLSAAQFVREVDQTHHLLHPDAWSVLHQRRNGPSKRLTPEQWLSGANGAFYSESPTLVRRKGDTLQTSRGAEVPFKQAVKVYLKASQCRANGMAWHRNGERVQVGAFDLADIDATGNIRVGCHTIQFEEMERLAVREVPHLVKPRFAVPALISA